MAAFPCMLCDQRFAGEAKNVYLTLYRTSLRLRARFVVCPSCEDDLVAPWVAKSLYHDPDAGWLGWAEGQTEDCLFFEAQQPPSWPPRR